MVNASRIQLSKSIWTITYTGDVLLTIDHSPFTTLIDLYTLLVYCKVNYIDYKIRRGRFTDIYHLIRRMKTLIDIKRVKFYLWVGLVYLIIWVLHNASNYPGNFFPLLFNNIWRIAYIIVLNFLFFEYTVPFVLRKRHYIIYNILLGILVLWIFIMLWSFGLYAWRAIGIGLNIYTPLTTFDTTEHALESQMSYSVGSVFFFGIIRHIYNYTKL